MKGYHVYVGGPTVAEEQRTIQRGEEQSMSKLTAAMEKHDWHFTVEPRLTRHQLRVLNDNDHLVHGGQLDDGDLLVLDKLAGAGPYVLTRDGKVQGVDYHYHRHHAFPMLSEEGPA